MTRHWLSISAALLLAVAISSPVTGAEMPLNWDGLLAVKAKRLDAVYLLPGADFRPYTKVMLDPTEAAMRKDWLRDYNRDSGSVSRRITESDIQKALETVRTKFHDVFAKAYGEAGYQVVMAPGPDVLRLRTAVINLNVNAPDVLSPGRTRSFAPEAGEATLILEARDSMTGALMGRAVDRRYAGDTSPLLRNSVTNKSDFTRLFTAWAKESVDGLSELKAVSLVDVSSISK